MASEQVKARRARVQLLFQGVEVQEGLRLRAWFPLTPALENAGYRAPEVVLEREGFAYARRTMVGERGE